MARGKLYDHKVGNFILCNHKSLSSRRNATKFGFRVPKSRIFHDDRTVTYRGPEETGLLLSYLRAVLILRICVDLIHFRKLDISKFKIDEILQFTS